MKRILGLLFALTTCANLLVPQAITAALAAERERAMELTLQSPSFEDGDVIPQRFTGNGENVSPELRWNGAPSRTKSFVVVMDDPDAPTGTWVHWVAFDIPANITTLPENAGAAGGKKLPQEARQGVNSWFERGLAGGHQYSGPMPPRGQTHRYVFQVYALDVPSLGIKKTEPTKAQVTQAMEGHILASAELMAKYSQPEN